MARVQTFSRTFPAYHPKAGQPTWFTEKFWKSMYELSSFNGYSEIESEYQRHFPVQFIPEENIHNNAPKHHTIRAGNRWKVGDKFSPRVWGSNINPKTGRSGPYHSDQIIIAPDMEVKKLWNFRMIETGHIHIFINGKEWLTSNGNDFFSLMKNDGLEPRDFKNWFEMSPEFKKKKEFVGQIITWNENINY